MILDGAMGTMIRTPDKALLNLTQPDTIKNIHRQYLEAGADIIKTNTFSIESRVYEISLAGAGIARSAVDEAMAADPGKPRFVAGSVGPARQSETYFEQARGLMEGGVDVLFLETVVDTGSAKAAVSAFERCFVQTERRVPIMMSATIDRDGRILSGETVEAFWDSISDVNLLSVGINCAFGGTHMRPYIEKLSTIATAYVSCHPNAGLPNASGSYDDTPTETSAILKEFAANGWLNIAGGCCGTTPEHIRALANSLRSLTPRRRHG